MRNIEEIVNRQINRWHKIKQVVDGADSGPGEEIVEPVLSVHPPICISRTLGSGGRTLAKSLCELLGYTLFGKDLIDEIAKDLKVQRNLINSLDERSRNHLELMFETYLKGREIDWEEYQASLVRVIQTLGTQGGVVFLGRAACFVLKEKAALRVFLTAELRTRIERVMEYMNIDYDEAQEMVKASDLEREKFHQESFKITNQLPVHYDLCINTTGISTDACTHLVINAIELRGYNINRMRIKIPEVI